MEPKTRLTTDLRIQLPCHSLFVGGSLSGKTHLCLRLLSNPDLFRPKPKLIHFHYDILQSDYLTLKENLSKLDIELRLIQGCSDISLESLEKIDGQTIVVIDDFTEETSSSKAIARIATNARHLDVSLWLVWHSLYMNTTTSRTITQNMCHIFCLPSPRLASQLRTFGSQLGLRDAVVKAYKACLEEENRDDRYLLIDLTPNKPSILRLRSRIHASLQYCYS